MAHKTVVRNKAYQPVSFNTVERHNERKNEEYFNGDVQLERADLNVHFRRCLREDGTPETYQETFDRLLAERKIVKHGTKPDAKLFCEFVYDINTTYFDERGGYEFAKKFYEEAYCEAIKEAGSEDYIISAVMHADERNSMLSEKLGRDIYHYHLHVVYVPVVEKKLYFKKNNADPEKAGKLKEVIPQITQSMKWPLRMTVERDGKTVTRNSYSFLQDRYHEHMKAAGFEDFERGERGSTTEHLEVLEYKIQQDRIQAAELAADIERKQNAVAALDEKSEKKKVRLDNLNEQITVKEKAKATIKEVEEMGHPIPLVPGVHFTADEAAKLKTLAKKSVTAEKKAQDKIDTLNGNIRDLNSQITTLKQNVNAIARDRDTWKANYERLWSEVKEFIGAIRKIPDRLKAFIAEHLPHQERNKEVSR
ncbi:MAG: plasmid recombination protein [Peptococcaceae bacterium]|nr:plasmid recombination protein [Peptococcaceae bacterium]